MLFSVVTCCFLSSRAVFYPHVLSSVVTCCSLSSRAFFCRPMLFSVVTCCFLSSRAVCCRHVLFSVVTCCVLSSHAVLFSIFTCCFQSSRTDSPFDLSQLCVGVGESGGGATGAICDGYIQGDRGGTQIVRFSHNDHLWEKPAAMPHDFESTVAQYILTRLMCCTTWVGACARVDASWQVHPENKWSRQAEELSVGRLRWWMKRGAFCVCTALTNLTTMLMTI